MGERKESCRFNHKEKHIGRGTSHPIGKRGPGEPAKTIDDADGAHEGGSTGSIHADGFLSHRRRYGEESDAAGDVGEEKPPKRPKFPGLDGFAARVLSAGLGGSGFLQFFRCIVGKLGEIYRFTGFWRHQIKR